MRQNIKRQRQRDLRINYRGEDVTRLENLTDAVFGIGITLLIFNLANPNSFSELLAFTKTLPAFLVSIGFLMLVWWEHLRFSLIYRLEDLWLTVINIGFIALVIFYVYPLRFLTLFLTNLLFDAGIDISIQSKEVPQLMIYYGFVAFGLYFNLFLFYRRALKLKKVLELNAFEIAYTQLQCQRLIILFAVPLTSIAISLGIGLFSVPLASMLSGMVYGLYFPAMVWWQKRYKKQQSKFPIPSTEAENVSPS
ncbi:MAG: TMEM175 family protein [Salibacteraceae bacterium]